MANKFIGYAGTYTRESSKGIYRFVLDAENGRLEDAEVAAETGNPTYITIDGHRSFLYSVAQVEKEGGASAYRLNGENGVLEKVGKEQVEEGAPPCHLDVRNGFVVTGNYHKGTVDLYPVNEDGSLGPLSSSVAHEGNGPHERQEKPHVHYTGFSPDGKYIHVCDLGTDEITTYQVKEGKLERLHALKIKPGSGPRHLVFHPGGKLAYLITELSSQVFVLDYDEESGVFTEKQAIAAIPADFTETNDASAIHISPDGRFVYAGNRGHNSIAVFRVDQESGKLEHVENVPTGGDWPRDFCLDPSGRYVVAANQKSGNLVLFARDEETGKLTQTSSSISVPETVCVKFLG